MAIRRYDNSSAVEERELSKGAHRVIYPPVEKIRVVEVENFPSLGRLAALRFVEWALKNPGGVVAIPTGKTPEYSIKWVRHLLANWTRKDVAKLLHDYGIVSAGPPKVRDLAFVQIDEFYPIDASQQNSFHHYVREFYIDGFGFDPNAHVGYGVDYSANPLGDLTSGISLVGKNAIVPENVKVGRNCVVAGDSRPPDFTTLMVPSGTTVGYAPKG